MTSEARICIGFADSSFTVPCPELVTCEVRVQKDGVWATWKPMCERHGSGMVNVLSTAEGYAVERRPLCPGCADVLVSGMREDGAEVTVSTAEPFVPSPYTERFVCPHGVTYYMEPTGDQLAAWAAEAAR